MLKLWVKSGGRCEFPGCNEEVWRDNLTLKEDNFAHIAHNIAASPNGPRGDKILSPILETDFDNLLLLCLKCSKLVDGKNQEKYSVNQLTEYKRRHEERINLQTSLGPDLKTTVVRLEAPIRERTVSVPTALAYEALENRYPSDDKGIFINFNNKAGSGDEEFWKAYHNDIKSEVNHSLRRSNNLFRFDHLSIFGLAPIPILIALGNAIGNIIPSDIYQKHRDTDDWKWKIELKKTFFEYLIKKPNQIDLAQKEVALILSLSGKVSKSSVESIVGQIGVYEITIENPNPSFLMFKSRLEEFKILYRSLISEIQNIYGNKIIIHLFAAIPAPIAITCGQQLLPKADPSVVVYDFDHNQGGFIKTITIN